MNNRIKIVGEIEFDISDKTKKHKGQSSWKKIAMVLISGDICDYYAWFIKKRYNLILNKPLRNGHISFINDSMRDLTLNGERTEEETEIIWESVKTKWDGKEIEIILDVDPRMDGVNIWLNIPHEERYVLQEIREELGLGNPYWGLHMTIGRARTGIMEEHCKYIHDLIIKGFIS